MHRLLSSIPLPRLWLWWVITLATALAVGVLAPQQLGVSLYKLSLVAMAALAGYWIDRALFPYSRPHQHIGGCATDRTAMVFCTSMIRRAIIVAAAMLSTGLGAQTLPSAAHQHRAELTRAARLAFGLDAPVPLLAAQIHQESGWRANAVSPVGAQGLAQFMPATARDWCPRVQGVDCNPFNATWAFRAQAGYMAQLLAAAPTRYVEYDRYWVALRAYNGGPGHWQAEARATGHAQPTRPQVDAACGQARRSPRHCPENLHYPQRILAELQPRYAAWGRVIAAEPERPRLWLRMSTMLGAA